MFNVTDITYVMAVIFAITMVFLSLYSMFFLIKEPLFYIYSKNNKRIPAKTLGMAFSICFAELIVCVFILLSFLIINAITVIYDYLNLPEIPNSIVFLILILIYIATVISFLKILKFLLIKPTGKINQTGSDL